MTSFRPRDLRLYLDKFGNTTLPTAAEYRARVDAIARRLTQLLDGQGGGNVQPPPPTNLTAVPGETSVSLSWDAVPSVLGYRLYASNSDELSTFVQIVETTETSAIETGLPADVPRYYYVTSFNEDLESEPSGIVSATPTGSTAPGPPDTPTGLDGDFTQAGEVTLTWDPFTGTTVGAIVQRSETTNSNYVDYASGQVDGGNFVDSNVVIGERYYYRLIGVNLAGDRSAPSTEVTGIVTDGDTTAPPVPTLDGLTPGDGGVSVEWGAVFASDLAGYDIGYATTPGGPYTTLRVGIVDTAVVRGLTNGTPYYFVVRSVDTARPTENVSAWSNELSATPAAVPGDETPPAPPRGFRAQSLISGQVILSWNPNTEPDLDVYQLYRKIPGSPIFEPVFPTITKETTTDVVGFVGTFQYYLVAIDVAGNVSDPSETITVETNGDGTKIGDQDPVNPTPVDGDTGLGPNHRAPGYNFDYVIDVSGGGYSGNSIIQGAGEYNRRVGLSPSDPDYIDMSVERTIAVLLPERVETKGVVLNAGNMALNERIDMNIENKALNIHFIGPWCGGALETKTSLMQRVRDDDPTVNWRFGMTRRRTDIGPNSVPGRGGGSIIRVDVTQSNTDCEVHFWCMEIEASGRAALDSGTSPNYTNFQRVTGEADTHYHLIRLHQDDIRCNVDGPPNWGISGWHTRVHIHGMYMDLPWSSEHALYTREEPYGDMVYEYFNCYRCGGQMFQKADRTDSPSIPTDRTDPGTTFWRHINSPNHRGGRWAGRASAWFTSFESHQANEFDDVVIAEIQDVGNCRANWASWSPNNTEYSSAEEAYLALEAVVYTDNIADRPYNFTNGTWQMISTNGNAGATQDSDAPYPGYFQGPLTMRDCLWFSARPTKELLSLRSSPAIDVENCGFYTGIPNASPAYDTGGGSPTKGRSIIGLGTKGRGGIQAQHLIASCRWVGNNTLANRTTLQGAPFNIPPGDLYDPQMRLGDGGDIIATADQDITFTNFTGPTYQAGVDPSDLSVT